MAMPWRDRRGRSLPLKAGVLAALFIPGLLYAFWLATDRLGGRPLTALIHATGLWAIRFLLLSLAVTPFARSLDWNGLLLVRRNVGVAAACYAVAHLSLYVADENFSPAKVVSEIALRFYLSIGFAALLVLLALAWTSTDRWVKRLGRNWRRLHRLAYPTAAVALLHFHIQSKANVSEPVLVSGLFLWLMLWRAVPETWRRSRRAITAAGVCAGLAVISAAATAALELAWYGLATRINPWRVLAANETIAHGLRPAHWVLLAGIGVGVLFVGRRLIGREPLRRAATA